MRNWRRNESATFLKINSFLLIILAGYNAREIWPQRLRAASLTLFAPIDTPFLSLISNK
jgi:hypothetical protein